MAGFIKRRGSVLFRSQTLATVYSKFQRNNCTVVEGVMEKCSSIFPVVNEDKNSVDTSKWKKVRASEAGIKNSMVPEYSLNVLRVLRRQGFDAYLVGGCVRDLILHRVPKDYDVITTANHKQIRKLFHRAQVIGKRFPICHVWMGGSIIEVSSFDTVAQSDSELKNDLGKSKEISGLPQNTEADKNSSSLFKMYSGWGIKDCNRWKNSLQRDFTINSLFFDPLEFKVYDYANGMEDLKDLKLRTLVPARLSFKEDCARILRGLRIAARLGLSFSKDIETEIPEFVSSVANLDQFRLFMEMNYMLAYGAAAPSILLLMKFKLLHFLLPFQAAYLDQASKTSLSSSSMLVRLLSNMDKLVSCDQPADSRLWIAVLAFHIALVHNPQEISVIRAFASLLYHGNWNKALQFAREQENSVTGYALEISKSSTKGTNEDLAVAVSDFTYLLNDALYVLTQIESLREALYLYPHFKCSGLVFIPKKKGREVGEVFGRLSDVESYETKKPGFSIDYLALGKGNPFEISFVLGKIILDTITEGVAIEQVKTIKKKESSKPSKEDSNDHAVSKAQKKILRKMREDREHMDDQKTEVCPDLIILAAPEKNQDQSVVKKQKRRRSKEAPVSEVSERKTSKRSRSAEQESVPPVSEPPKQKTSKKSTRKVKLNKEIQNVPVSEVSKPKTSERSRSDEQETALPVSESPKPKTSKKSTRKVKVVKEIQDAPVSEVSKPKTSKRSRSDEQETVPPVSEPPKQRASKKEIRKVKRNVVVKEIQEAEHNNLASEKSMKDILEVLEKSSQQQQPSSKEERDSLSSETTKKPSKLSSLFR